MIWSTVLVKKSRRRGPAKESAAAPAKLSRKAKPAKSRAAPLSFRQTKKTTQQKSSRVQRRAITAAEVAKAKTSEALREQIKVIGSQMDAPADAATRRRASLITSMPLTMVLRQQALALDFMLGALQMQRQFFSMWRSS